MIAPSALENDESWLAVLWWVKLVAAGLVALGVALEFGGDWISLLDEYLAAQESRTSATSAHGWWTPERQQHAIQALEAGGVSPLGAAALVSRWMNVESAGGPGSVNPITGAFGIGQWLGGRKSGIAGDTDFDDQLAYALRELRSTEVRAYMHLNAATDPRDAAIGASMYERAGGYNSATGMDDYTGRTAAGISWNMDPRKRGLREMCRDWLVSAGPYQLDSEVAALSWRMLC
jgi:Phage tail lysozyme